MDNSPTEIAPHPRPPSPPHRGRRSGRVRVPSVAALRASVTLLVLVGGVVVSVLLRNSAADMERRAFQADVDGRARERAQLLRAKLLRSMDVVSRGASLFETPPGVGRGGYRGFVAGPLRRQPELLALGWTPRVPGDRRAAFEAAARADGVADFEFREWGRDRPVPSRDRAEYLP